MRQEAIAHPPRRIVCTVADIENATHDIRVVRLAVESGGPFEFLAGQYASLEFPGLPPRDFSMASRPDEALLEFHIRLMPGGAITPYMATQIRCGDRVDAYGPLGTAYLRENHTGPIVALAGGSGLAPIKSIVETALARGMTQPIALYVGVRAERDLYLEEHFRALSARHPNLRVVPVLSAPDAPTQRRTGMLADALRQDFAPGALKDAKAYLAGPPIMVETAMAALITLGVRKQDCHEDAFYTEAEKAALAEGPS